MGNAYFQSGSPMTPSLQISATKNIFSLKFTHHTVLPARFTLRASFNLMYLLNAIGFLANPFRLHAVTLC